MGDADQSLRDALEKVLATTDGWAVSNETLLGLLAAHPAETAPDCPQTAEEEPHGPHQVATLEEGVWWDCPGFGAAASRPLLDREAVRGVIDAAVAVGGWEDIDRVMELARPMPTGEQIDALLQEWQVGPAFRPPDPDFPSGLPNYRRKFRNALLALLNEAES